MIPEVEACLHIFEGIKGEIRESMKDLNEDGLNWTPLSGEVSNSVYAIVVHICGSEAYMIHKVVGGRQVERDRDAEFRAAGKSVKELEVLLEGHLAATREVLKSLESHQLEETRDSQWGPTTVRRAILSQIQHQALHLGQIQITKQLYEADAENVR